MQTSPSGILLITRFEGCRTTAYKDLVGVWTIGFGHTRYAPVFVDLGLTLTFGQCEQLLRFDLKPVEEAINAESLELTQNQFDALACLIFNIGTKAFQESTLLKMLKLRDYPGAADQFSRWVKAGGNLVPGLVARRKAEADLFSL